MSNKSEKGNKTWKVVARFLLPPAILVSFFIPILIQIVEAGHSDLLEFIIIDNQIIAIITLLASLSLSVFLIQRYMNTKPKWADKIWKNVSQFLLLFVLLMSVFISIKMLIQIVGIWYPELLKYLTVFKDKPIIAIITLLASLSLSSFLLQVYMIIDPEKSNKTKGQTIAWCLLQPTLLISVLISVPILIVETWHPELLELKFLGGIIPDEQAYRQIITMTTLLASVSLLSFLLQIYMNTDSEKGDKIWKVVAYPVHWAIRIAARFLLLLAILVTVLITPIFYPIYYFLCRFDLLRLTAWLLLLFVILATGLILFLILLTLIQWYPDILESLYKFISKAWNKLSAKVDLSVLWYPDILESLYKFISKAWNKFSAKVDLSVLMIIALLVSIGLFSFLLNKSIKDIRESLSNIHKKIVKVFRYRGRPRMDIGQSLSVTWWCYFKRFYPFMKETFIQSQKLFFALLLSCIILVCGFLPLTDFKKWQDNVRDKLGAIRAYTDTIKTDTDAIRAETANLMILRSSGYSPAYLSTENDEISFLLVYPPQGDLESKKGICPIDSSLNLEWLRFFKKTFSECSRDTIKLRVQGFASVAPVTVNSRIDSMQSDIFNCEIANQRAEALIYFLMLPDSESYTRKKCEDALNDSLIWQGRTKSESTWEGSGFDVIYEPWQCYEEMKIEKMKKAKPVQDSLRLDLEFLNRSVKITIVGDSCLTKAVPASQ